MNTIVDELTDAQIGAAFRKLLGGAGKPGVDFDLLRQQKLDIMPLRIEDPVEDAVMGIVHFIDAFQDICVDDLGIWEFPVVHCSFPRGGNLCGADGENDADINMVTCDACLEKHEQDTGR